MKRFLAVLLIFLTLPAFAYADFISEAKAMYNLNAARYGLPQLPEPYRKLETSEAFYCDPTNTVICFMLSDSKPIGMCQTVSETKLDDFLMTSACVLDVMNTENNQREAHGFLLELYAYCKTGNDREVHFHEYDNGFIISFKKEAGIYTFMCGDM